MALSIADATERPSVQGLLEPASDLKAARQWLAEAARS